MVVDNKPGAGGLIAAQEVPAPRLTVTPHALAIATSSYSRLPYDVQRDFAPVSHIANTDFVLLTNPDKNPAKTAREFATWAK